MNRSQSVGGIGMGRWLSGVGCRGDGEWAFPVGQLAGQHAVSVMASGREDTLLVGFRRMEYRLGRAGLTRSMAGDGFERPCERHGMPPLGEVR